VLELRQCAVRVCPGRSSWNFYTMFRYSRPHTRPGIHPTPFLNVFCLTFYFAPSSYLTSTLSTAVSSLLPGDYSPSHSRGRR